jgi:hypothetical protein
MIPHFQKGNNKLSDLNRVVDAANTVESVSGDGLVELAHTGSGVTANINLAELAHRLPSRNVPRFVAKITGSGTPSWNIGGSGSGSGENITTAYSFAEQTLGPISGTGGEWINKTNGRGDSSTYNLFEINNETLEEGTLVYAWKQDVTADGKVIYACYTGSEKTNTLSGCWRLYIDGTGSGTLDSGDWSDVVLTHWGKAMSNPYDGPLSHASYQGLLYEDDSFNIDYMTPGLYPVVLDFEEISSNNFEWYDSGLSEGNIYVDDTDGSLKWECTDYTADTLVFYRATGVIPTDIGTPFS